MLHDPLVVRADRREPRRPGNKEVIEESAAITRITLDQGEILWREEHHAQGADDLPGLADRSPVEPGPVRAARVDLQFDQRTGGRRVDLNAHDRTLSAAADQRRVGGRSVAPERGGIAHGLHKVGLAVAVRADEAGHTRPKPQVNRGIGAEVGKCDPGDVHVRRLRSYCGYRSRDLRVPRSGMRGTWAANRWS